MRPKRIVAISSPCCRELAVDFIRRVLIETNARSHPRREVAAQAGLR